MAQEKELTATALAAGHTRGHGGHKQAPAPGDKHHGGHGGGGHGGSWVITYCDMITLLIACFICIITFASKETEKYARRRDSLLFGTGGTGIAEPVQQQGLDHDSFLWRQRPLISRLGLRGAEMPPLYSDPTLESTAEVLKKVEGPTLGTLADSYTMHIPMTMLFDSNGGLSPSGRFILDAVAQNVRQLPYDIYIRMAEARDIPKGLLLCQYLVQQRSFHPSRMAVGVQEGSPAGNPSVQLVFVRRS